MDSSICEEIRQAISNQKVPIDTHVKDLAIALKMSSSTLQRRARTEGVSVRQFLNSLKVEYAQKLLIDTNISVEMISKKSGFHDRRSLDRNFRKFFNTTPCQFRSNVRSEK